MANQEPWGEPSFADRVLDLQRKRQLAVEADTGGVVFFDRSPVCTLALCRYLDLTVPCHLFEEIERMVAERRYEQTAFFVRHQGFIQATAARRISFEDSLAFEKVHELTYREVGFDLFEVPTAPLRPAWPRFSRPSIGCAACREDRALRFAYRHLRWRPPVARTAKAQVNSEVTSWSGPNVAEPEPHSRCSGVGCNGVGGRRSQDLTRPSRIPTRPDAGTC